MWAIFYKALLYYDIQYSQLKVESLPQKRGGGGGAAKGGGICEFSVIGQLACNSNISSNWD